MTSIPFSKMKMRFRRNITIHHLICGCSRQEARVLLSLMEGKTYQSIADEMGIGKDTVQDYAERAKSKLARMRENGVQSALFDDFNVMGDMDGVYISGLFRQPEPELAVH